MRRFLWVPVVLAVVAVCAVGRSDDRSGRLASAIEAVTSGPDYKHAHWGLLFVDLESGATVYEHNRHKLFVPASTTKLYSVASALGHLGADYRFQTPVVRRGEVTPSGQLQGDLILLASGDLSMGGRLGGRPGDRPGDRDRIAFTNTDHTYANGNTTATLTESDPLAGLNELARQVAAAGVKQVRGDVLIDDRLFDKAEGTGSGPSRLTPIMINDNLLDLLITPAKPGSAASVRVRPETAAYTIDAQVDTVESGQSIAQPIRIRITMHAGNRVVLRGQIPAGHRPLVRVVEVEDAAGFARSLFIEALRRAGVTVDASPLATNRPERLPPRDACEKLPRVALLTSPPFGESAKLILKVSHNLHASTLPLLVAAKHGKRTLDDGLRLQHDFLKKAGVEVETISFGGGAGGSRADYTTPHATVQLLRYMATRPDFAVYEAALPILGVDGTLHDTVKPDSPARGKVRAKTGTLFWQNIMNDRFLLTGKALAGYMTTANGRKLAFAMFVNNTHLPKATDTSREGKILGKLCEIVYESE